MRRFKYLKLLSVVTRMSAVAIMMSNCATPLTRDDVVLLPAVFAPLSSTSISGTAGSVLSDPGSVRVLDRDNEPMPNLSVAFTASGNGSLSASSVSTDVQGEAAAPAWTLPTTTGQATLTATVSGGNVAAVVFTASVTPGPVSNAVAVDGSGTQSAAAGTAVPVAPAVFVSDEFQNPIQGVSVTFSIASGSGTLNGSTAATITASSDASGTARLTSWILGRTAANNSITAVAEGLETTPVTFTAVGEVGAAAKIVIAPGSPTSQGQSAVAGTTVPVAPAVLVTDAVDNPVSGASMRFTVAAGNGRILADASDANGVLFVDVLTDASGIASIFAWKLGAVGSNSIGVTIPSVSSVPAFSITATAIAGAPASIEIVSETPSSDGQTATAGTDVPVAPGVVVKDAQGNPVPDVAVTFEVGASSGAVQATSTTGANSSASVQTDANGIARLFSWTLGPVGPNSLSAKVESNTSLVVAFTATAIAGTPASIEIVSETPSSDGQTAIGGTAVPVAPGVIVKDAQGNPVPDVAVTFEVGASSGAVQATSSAAAGSSASVQTDASGIARLFSWTLGSVGPNSLSAMVEANTSLAVAFTATAIAGTPASIEIVSETPSSDGQTATAGTAVPVAPGVVVKDAQGNPVPDVAVTFEVDASSGVVKATSSAPASSSASVQTDANGIARLFSWTLGPLGPNSLSAKVAANTNLAVTFTATAINAPAKIELLEGDGQSATVFATLATAPAVKVTDISGVGVSGITVVFAVTGGGGQVTDATVVTDASGVARAGSWTLGRTAGNNSLTATALRESSSGITITGGSTGTVAATAISGNPVIFNATATPGPAAGIAILTGPEFRPRNRMLFSPQPVIAVVDAFGNVVPQQSGVIVTASVDGTGATLQGTTTATTGTNSIAFFNNLSLAGTTGSRNLSFTTTQFGSVSTPINLVGGLPATIVANAGDSQSGEQLATLGDAVSVKVSDVDGNGVPGVQVRFAVISGGGQLSENSVFTDDAGIAGTLWTLGAAPGANGLSATATVDNSGINLTGSTTGTIGATSVSGNPVLFTATTVDRASCATVPSLTLGTALDGALDVASSCLRNLSGSYVPDDFYEITTTAPQTNFKLVMTSPELVPRLVSSLWSGPTFFSDGSSPLEVFYFVKPGTYSIHATSRSATGGSYNISSEVDPVIPSGCLFGLVTKSVSITHLLDTNCSYNLNSGAVSSSKRYFINVDAGTTLTVTMSSSEFDTYLELYGVDGTARTFVVADDDGAGVGTNSRIVITPTVSTFYEIRAGNFGGSQQTGSFTLTIDP